MDPLVAYYSRRAPEYDRIFERDDPGCQQELRQLAGVVGDAARGRSVLELACGTGHWTLIAAESARRIVATDASEAMLQIARQKLVSSACADRSAGLVQVDDGQGARRDSRTSSGASGDSRTSRDAGGHSRPSRGASGDSRPSTRDRRMSRDSGTRRDSRPDQAVLEQIPGRCEVALLRADAFAPAAIAGDFELVMANFWLSHVRRERLPAFLDAARARVGPGGTLFFADNVYVPGVGGECVQLPGDPDTYKRRTLADGSAHTIVKNYFSHDELTSLLSPHGRIQQLMVGNHYWWSSVEVRSSAG